LNAWNQFESLRESVSIGGTGAGREGRTPLKTMIAVFGFLSLFANWKKGWSEIRNLLMIIGCGGTICTFDLWVMSGVCASN
jgi:hypothetical protein